MHLIENYFIFVAQVHGDGHPAVREVFPREHREGAQARDRPRGLTEQVDIHSRLRHRRWHRHLQALKFFFILQQTYAISICTIQKTHAHMYIPKILNPFY